MLLTWGGGGFCGGGFDGGGLYGGGGGGRCGGGRCGNGEIFMTFKACSSRLLIHIEISGKI